METLIGQEVTVERLFPDGTKDCISGEVIEVSGTMLRITSPKLENLTPDHVLERNGGGKYHHGIAMMSSAIWVNTASPIVLSIIEN